MKERKDEFIAIRERMKEKSDTQHRVSSRPKKHICRGRATRAARKIPAPARTELDGDPTRLTSENLCFQRPGPGGPRRAEFAEH